MRRSKMLSTIIAALVVMSALFVVSNVTDFKLVEKASAIAAAEVTKNGATTGLELTCGELVTFKVVDNSLTYNEDYGLAVWNGSAWCELETGTADYNGDITIDFNTPWWDLLGKNPILEQGGQWNIRLFNTTTESSYDSDHYASANVTLTIGNLFDVIFYEGNTEIDHIMFNKSYNVFTNNELGVKVRNFTGAGTWDESFTAASDPDFDMSLFLPDGTEYSSTLWGATADENGVYSGRLLNGLDGTGYHDGDNYESFFWVNVSVNGEDHKYSNVSLPCKINVSEYNALPTNPVWGDTFDVSVIIKDGNGNYITTDNDYQEDYQMAIYAPINGGFTLVDRDDAIDGLYYYNDLDTGLYSAGSWYIGTLENESSNYRIKETEPDKAAGLPTNFIPYIEFDVATYDEVDVDFRTTGDVISGFEQTINVSVDNVTGYNNLAYRNLTSTNFHITGLKAWNSTANVEYDDDDVVCIADLVATSGVNSGAVTCTKWTSTRAYYEFTYRFNQTGTATVIVTYPGNGTYMEGKDSFYSDTYDNEKLLANWEGSTTFDVTSPGNLNMIVRGNMATAVSMTDLGSDAYRNTTGLSYYIDFYGSDSTERVNATLEVSGCGLDFTIEPSDTVAGNPYLVDKATGHGTDVGWYQVKIEPKTGGTLSLTATNGSDTDSADYTIEGLKGSVETAVDNDQKISVTEKERIRVTVKSTNGYPIETADVYLTLFDEDWTNLGSINTSDGDDLDGTDGIYDFVPDSDDIENVGYIVCAGKSGGLWMYDVVEIEPLHDIDISIINPVGTANQTLTVGIDNQVLEVEIKDTHGNILEGSAGGSPTVTGYLTDDDHPKEDPLQTLTFEQKASQDKWVLDTSGDNFPYFAGTLLIEVVNNTGEDEHDGNVTIPVDYATCTFSPAAVVAGTGKKNVTIEVTVLDALGNPVEEGTEIYLNLEDATGTDIDDSDESGIELDADGKAEFEIDAVGNFKGKINVTFVDNYAADFGGGNVTEGRFNIDYPVFTITPSAISTELSSATVTVIAKDFDGSPIEGLNLSFSDISGGNCIEAPDPVVTDENGQAVFDITPLSSGKANVTMYQGLSWTNTGSWNWAARVYTTSYLTITRQTLDVTVSPTKVYAGDTFTVTVKDDGVPIEDAAVLFDGTTKNTGSSGQATFTSDDPGIESYEYTITVTKDGYPSATAHILVINKYQILISTPSTNPAAGEKFTVTVLAKGSGLGGATVTFNGKEVISDNDGKATFTAPDKEGDYTVTATFDDARYKDGTATITVASGTPGFELLTLIAAIGIAFILLRRRRQ